MNEAQDDTGPVPMHRGEDLSGLGREQLVRRFVEHWGMMARSWGINPTMGELFALLYISGTDWTADALREWLHVSRGNVSMNLRELMGWGVVHKSHRAGERREFYRAETEVWTLFRHIVSERKRRELDPTLQLLSQAVTDLPADPSGEPLHDRIAVLLRFFQLIDGLVSRMLLLDSDDLDELRQLLESLSSISGD